jgi:hypothetical protein
MKWNNFELEVGSLMVELEEGVPFWDSPIGFNLGSITIDYNPSLQDPTVSAYLKKFEKFGTKAWVGIEENVSVLTQLPPVFVASKLWFPRQEAIDTFSEVLGETYKPFNSNLSGIGYLPNRPDSPVREYTKEGKVFEGNTHIGTEFFARKTDQLPSWVIDLIADANDHVECAYSHHKISADGTVRKAYIMTKSL